METKKNKPKNGKKIKKIALYSIATLFTVSMAVSEIANFEANKEEELVIEQVSKVSMENVSDLDASVSYIEAVAEVEALEKIDIYSQNSARVNMVNVEIGDTVKKGDLLVELDHAALDAQLEQASAAISRYESTYDKLVAGASQEDINKSLASIESTKVANAVAIQNAEQALEQAELNLNNLKESNDQSKNDSYDNLRTLLKSNLSSMYATLVGMGNILGEEPGLESADDTYADIFSVKDLTVKQSVELKYSDTVLAYNNLKTQVDGISLATSNTSLKNTANQMVDVLNVFSQTLDTLDTALEKTTTSNIFPEASLSALKANNLSYQTTINTLKQATIAQVQQVETIGLSDTTSLGSYEQQYNKAVENLALVKEQAAATLALQEATHQSLVASARQEDLQVSQSSVAEARASYNQIAVSRNNAFVRAPFDGVIASVAVDQGDLASMGTLLVTMVNEDGLQLRTYISETDRQLIAQGAKVLVGETIEAEVSRIAPSVDPSTKKVEILILVSSENPNITIGQFADIKIYTENDGSEGIYYLPLKSVEILSDGGLVYTVDENNILISHEVSLGKVVDEYITVNSGIESDWQIVKNVRGLKAGDSVEIK